MKKQSTISFLLRLQFFSTSPSNASENNFYLNKTQAIWFATYPYWPSFGPAAQRSPTNRTWWTPQWSIRGQLVAALSCSVEIVDRKLHRAMQFPWMSADVVIMVLQPLCLFKYLSRAVSLDLHCIISALRKHLGSCI